MELSAVATFDDLRRCDDVLIEANSTSDMAFRDFLAEHERWRLKYIASTHEAERLQHELDKAIETMADLETKMFHARRLLEVETKARREAESERDSNEKKMQQVREFLREPHINDETRNKLAFLNSSSRKRKSKTNKYLEEKYGNEINSTGSFLSDLSVTQSEDDFLDIGVSHAKPWKKHRPSGNFAANGSFMDDTKKSRPSEGKVSGQRRKVFDENTGNCMEIGGNDKIRATTRVSIPRGDGPIQASSVIEAIPQTAPSCDKNNRDGADDAEAYAYHSPPTSPKRTSMKSMQYITPSAPPLHELNNQKLLLNLQGRQHAFNSKTFLRPDTCAYCLKKIRFGAMALKCRSCRVCVHTDCRVQYAGACVPKSQGTPNLKGGQIASLSDYAPNEGPMVPALIVHCINEIETRGLTEEGIYRVSGSEREIKQLKERFLRSKTIPKLSDIDIHVICGCIKDFLRNLNEPIIPTNLWRNFSNAVQNIDDNEAVRELYSAINRLPQANRDTLAFLIQHLQRVANCVAVKMPISNLSKIFGPTVLGYSSAEPDQHAIYTETIIQANVMQHLLNIPTDYWSRFLNVDSSDKQSDVGPNFNMTSSSKYFATPTLRNGNSLRKEKRFFNTPPYSTKRK